MANAHRKGIVALTPPEPVPPPPALPPPPPPTSPTSADRPFGLAYKTPARVDPRILIRRFGELIRTLRDRRGFTQGTLADRSGLDRAHLSLIERGHREARLTTICAIATALQTHPGELITLTLDPAAAAGPRTAPAPPPFVPPL